MIFPETSLDPGSNPGQAFSDHVPADTAGSGSGRTEYLFRPEGKQHSNRPP